MPSSKSRHRVEIDADLFDRMRALATREGYPMARFTDKLLYLAIRDYVKARREGKYPFADLADQQAEQDT